MIENKIIDDGIEYLLSIKNQDGGIPATKPMEISGCWTSGETLEALLLSNYNLKDLRPFVFDIINFLISSQIKEGKDQGSWPLVVNGKKGSTMATGHILASFQLAQKYFYNDEEVFYKLNVPIKDGIKWLEKNINNDGGWGVEPNGGLEGEKSRLISTTYALKSFFYNDQYYDNSKTVRRAIDYILTLYDSKTGGFSGKSGDTPDPCNSSRAISAIIISNYKNSRLLRKCYKFLIDSKPPRQLWNLDIEVYVTEGAPGMTIYNSNTTADILEALIRLQKFNNKTMKLIDWYINNQEDNGFWYLGANNDYVKEITTWSTNEAILSLTLAQKFNFDYFSFLKQKIKAKNFTIICLLLLSILFFIYPAHNIGFIKIILDKIPKSITSGFVNILIGGVVVSIITSIIMNNIEFLRRFKDG